MRRITSVIGGLWVLGVLASCGGRSDRTGEPQNPSDSPQVQGVTEHKKPIPPMSLEELLETPTIEGRVANSDDVRSGLAYFSFNTGGSTMVHKALPLPMPFFAYRKSDRFMDTVLVIFQVERLGEDTLMAWRSGWNERGQDNIRDLLVGTTGKSFKDSDFSGYRESHEEKLVKELERRGS